MTVDRGVGLGSEPAEGVEDAVVGDGEGTAAEVGEVAERPQVIAQGPECVAGRNGRGGGSRRELLVGQEEVDARAPEVTVGDG